MPTLQARPDPGSHSALLAAAHQLPCVRIINTVDKSCCNAIERGIEAKKSAPSGALHCRLGKPAGRNQNTCDLERKRLREAVHAGLGS